MIRRFLAYNKTVAKSIPSAQAYVQRFANLQSTLKDQNKKIEELQRQVQLAEKASLITVGDQMNKFFSKLSGKNFESKGVKQIRMQLVVLRKELEKKIHQSDEKWTEPRKEIIKLRKEISQDFLSNFVRLEQNLLNHASLQTSPQLSEGLSLIHKLLLTNLTKHGVKFFEPEIGEAYDKSKYDTADKQQKGEVIKKVLSKGWKIGQNIIKKPVVHIQ